MLSVDWRMLSYENMAEISKNTDVNDPDFFRFIAPTLPESNVVNMIIKEQKRILNERTPGKYVYMFLALGIFRRMEVPYYFGRIIDDQVDGDQEIPTGFSSCEDYIDYLKNSLEEKDDRTFRGGIAEFLMLKSVSNLEKLEQSHGETKTQTVKFLDAMLSEHQRRTKQGVLTRVELTQRYHDTFDPPQDITFIATGSPTRSSHVPDLALAQGKSFAVKDLKPDISKGICNIPAEILDQAELTFPKLMEDPNLVDGNGLIQEWRLNEQREAEQLVDNLWRMKLEPRAWALVRFLTLGVKREYNLP